MTRCRGDFPAAGFFYLPYLDVLIARHSQAGLPQDLALLPILFLFLDMNLVQRKSDASGGDIAFVDDYSAYGTGLSAEATA